MIMLETREIIVTEIDPNSALIDSFIFLTPGLVTVSRGMHGSLGFMLTSWAPHEIMKDTQVVFLKSKVVGHLDPHPAMISFYRAWAETERDKLVSFEKDFAFQIQEIEKFHKEKYARTKEAHLQDLGQGGLPGELSNAVFDLFDANTGWGDPSVTQ